MNTNVWAESGGAILKEALRQEAKILHQMHQPPASIEGWSKMREGLRGRLLAAAGTFPPPPKLEVREHGVLAMDGYRIVKLSYQSRPGLRVTANLFIPDTKGELGKFPGVLNLHGHWKQGKIHAEVAARGHTLAKEGFVTLSVDAIGAGERGTLAGEFEYHGDQQGVSLLSVGETLLGMQVYDNMRAIDLLQSLEYVDGERIGVTGESGGGNQTMWISAMDSRVKASVPVVSTGTFEAYITNGNCWCETLPDGLTITEEWAVLALLAPNPLLMLTALRENIPAFLIHEMVRSYDSARQIYRLMGMEERIAYQAIDLPHGYFPEMRRHMLGWFKRWLRDEGTGWPCAIPQVPDLPEAQLLCFPGKSRPADMKSTIEYVSLRSKAAKNDLLKRSQLNRNGKVKELREMLRVPESRTSVRISASVTGTGEEWGGGVRFEKFSVESEPQILVPCLLAFPKEKWKPLKGIVIAVHPDGKSACLNEPAAQEVLAAGKALCLVDLRGIGELSWEHPDGLLRVGARAMLWLGRTMIGNWIADLLAVRVALGQRTSAKRVELLGFGEMALATLATVALEKRFSGVAIVNMLATYVVDGTAPIQRYSIFVPGILNWGDVSLMAALAHCPVQIKSLTHPSGARLSKKEVAAWMREVGKFQRILAIKAKWQARKDAAAISASQHLRVRLA